MKFRQTLLPIIIAALLTMLLGVTLQGAQTASQPEETAATNGRVHEQEPTLIADLTSSAEGLSFVLTVPTVQQGDAGQVEVPGLKGQTSDVGAPALPFYATFIALPPEATAVLSVEPVGAITLPNWTVSAVTDPQSAAAVEPGNDYFSAVLDEALTSAEDPAIYGKDGNFPGQLYEISEPMYIRDNRLVKLELFPIQYNPVSRQLTQYQELRVTIEFTGGTTAERPLNGRSPFTEALDSLVLNAEQAQNWASLPADMFGPSTVLPVGSDAYKLEVDQDGIYEVTYADLQASGMNVGSVNPNTFQMLYRGQPVAYEFIGDADSQFESGEKVRFYGWAFNGSRLEEQFINDNVFWLWASGTPTTIGSVASQNGLPLATTFRSSITTEPVTIWHASWTDQWDSFPNEPDAWYWDRLTKGSAAPVTDTYNIVLPHPSVSGADADVTVEITSKPNPVVSNVQIAHEVAFRVNGDPNKGYASWFGKQNLNITTTLPVSSIVSGTNSVAVGLHTAAAVSSGSTALYLNRITFDYDRLFTADNDQLIFNDEIGGSRGFQVNGYSQNNISNIIVWDVTNPVQPQKLSGVSVTGAGPTYTYEFGTNHPAGSTFIATTDSNILSPNQISRYDVPDLEPAGNGANWVAIAYGDFITETQVLANHREDPLYGGYETHVVDVEDVINQYGYGLPIPAAISDYLSHGLTSWQTAPAYLLLVGDATIDPHKTVWTAPQYLLADLAFVDRYQGQIPSDLAFSLLVGADILPDLAVGRIPAKTAADVTAVVDKIIIYDQNQQSPADWMNDIIYVSDNTDSGGNFCLENQTTAGHIPDVFNNIQLCLPENPTTIDGDNLRNALFNHINVTGTLLLNYRGHGAINTWASSPTILDPTHVSLLTNATKPIVIVTGDCLDGFFAYPIIEGLGETYLRAAGKGTAAHWSSSGLGLSDEHTFLVDGFYDAVFIEGLTALGDAANFAKIQFDLVGGHRSLLYSFNLEGDPAMELMRPELSIDKTAVDTTGEPGDTAEFTLDIANQGLYPDHVVVTDTLPDDLNYVSFQSSLPTTVTVTGNDIVFNLQFGNNTLNAGLPIGESALITLTTMVDTAAISGTVTNSAVISGFGLDTVPNNNNDSVNYDIFIKTIIEFDFRNFIPVVFKS